MPRHSNFPDIFRLSSGICADGMAWKRKIFPQQQRTLDSPFLFSLSNDYGPEKNQNLSKFSEHFHHWKASRILSRLAVSLGMSSSCYPSIPFLWKMKNWIRIKVLPSSRPSSQGRDKTLGTTLGPLNRSEWNNKKKKSWVYNVLFSFLAFLFQFDQFNRAPEMSKLFRTETNETAIEQTYSFPHKLRVQATIGYNRIALRSAVTLSKT